MSVVCDREGNPLQGRFVSLQKKAKGQFDINELEIRVDDLGGKCAVMRCGGDVGALEQDLS